MLYPAWPLMSDGRSRDRNRAILQRIAHTLGCSPQTLLREADKEAYPDEAAELVRLWFKIKDPTVRQTLLLQVQKAARR